jgi:peptidoglycan/xylan/chitin deacetylase (PgdA/CDA1 family)
VFDVMSKYLLWKASGARLTLRGVLERDVVLDDSGRSAADKAVKDYARREGLSAEDKDRLLADIADRLGIDYSALCRKRLFHIMRPSEAGELAGSGIDIQLHTHRHRVPVDRELLTCEIERNREIIEQIRGGPATHFCYPSGVWFPEFEPWLRACGMESAVTCRLGLATWRTPPYRLPRFLDSSSTTETEFDCWVSGVAAVAPHRYGGAVRRASSGW